MRSVALTIFLAATWLALSLAEDPEAPTDGSPDTPVKLDKNLRRALLKALADLDAESSEQRKPDDEPVMDAAYGSLPPQDDSSNKKDLNKDFGLLLQEPDAAPKVAAKSTFSFDDFPSDEEIPSEDKLQNSTFVQADRPTAGAMTIEKASRDDARSFHVVMADQPVPSYAESPSPKTHRLGATAVEKSSDAKFETSVRATGGNGNLEGGLAGSVGNAKLGDGPSGSVANAKFGDRATGSVGSAKFSESLTGSASNAFSSLNSLSAPKPTVPTPSANLTRSEAKEKSEEVKIFQAPLVAAFTVQQDERGIPKSVVPIYRSPGDAQALTLQEQLDFKQMLLEKQLAELQQQQFQQTQFLVRQRQLYEQQLRQRQQQELFLQEQARLKQFEEQARLKQLEEQARLKQLEEQARLKKQLEEQRLYRFQQQQALQPPRKQGPRFFDAGNGLQQPGGPLLLQQHADSANVKLQPSVALEVPSAAVAQPFQANFQEQLRLQQIRQQQQQQQQLQQQQQQQLQQQQQRLQQSFGSFSSEFQAPTAHASRFNRQEAFGAVGNFGFNGGKQPQSNFVYRPDGKQSGPQIQSFGFNGDKQSLGFFADKQVQGLGSNFDNKPTATRTSFNGFAAQTRAPSSFVYNPYAVRQQARSPQTPAKQIQHLLYQSGIAGDLGSAHGSGGQEDLNIVSKVLALNVGALPAKGVRYATSNRDSAGSA